MAQLSNRPQESQPDTWIQAQAFESPDDRRASPRVPTALKVRLGPAREPPSTTLLCEDVSEGGLFVRCGQPVQLGARFSVELTLASGEALYIPEAEVLYNVEGEGTRRGFGARFVSVTREAKDKLLEVARFGSDIAPRQRVTGSMVVATRDYTTARMRRTDDVVVPRVSDLRVATLRPAPLDDGEVHGGVTVEARGRELSVLPSVAPEPLPAPELASEVQDGLQSTPDTLVPAARPSGFAALGVEVLSAPPAEDAPSMHDGTLPPLAAELDAEPEREPERARRGSGARWWLGLASAAGVALVAAYLGGRGAPAGASTPERVPGRVSGAIAGALASPRDSAPIAAAEAEAATAARAAKAPGGGALSKLDAAAVVPRAVRAGEGDGAAPAAVAPAGDVAQIARASEAAADKGGAAVKAAPAAKAPSAAVAPKAAEAPAAKAPSAAVAPKAAAAPAAKAPSAAVAPKGGSAGDGLDAALERLAPSRAAAILTVARGTTVRRTHVLREPARFVVDLDTQALPTVKSGQARVGRHDGFVRVVLDAPRALAGGRAAVDGERLTIVLEPR